MVRSKLESRLCSVVLSRSLIAECRFSASQTGPRNGVFVPLCLTGLQIAGCERGEGARRYLGVPGCFQR